MPRVLGRVSLGQQLPAGRGAPSRAGRTPSDLATHSSRLRLPGAGAARRDGACRQTGQSAADAANAAGTRVHACSRPPAKQARLPLSYRRRMHALHIRNEQARARTELEATVGGDASYRGRVHSVRWSGIRTHVASVTGVNAASDGGSFTVHRLVQEVTRRGLPAPQSPSRPLRAAPSACTLPSASGDQPDHLGSWAGQAASRSPSRHPRPSIPL
jgi:hypothetical protein